VAPQYAAAVGIARGSSKVHGSGRIPPSRILLGRLPNGARGLRISEPGYNASADPVDDTRLFFSTEWPDVMPVHQIGSAIQNPGLITQSVVTQTVDFPSLGYVPFVEFYVQSRADALPAGASTYPSSRWYYFNSMDLLYYQAPANAYLRLNISATQLRFESYTRNVSSNTFGAARSYVIYWCIYRKQAA
jgi:hypothetical protein